MHTKRQRDETALPRGNLLRLGEKREIAIYLRDGVTWVADFRGGCGKLFTAGEWFALNHCGGVLRGLGLDSIAPLPGCVVERIEQLHRAEYSADALSWIGRQAAAIKNCLRRTWLIHSSKTNRIGSLRLNVWFGEGRSSNGSSGRVLPSRGLLASRSLENQ